MSDNMFAYRHYLDSIKMAINSLCDELDKNRANLKRDDIDVQHQALL